MPHNSLVRGGVGSGLWTNYAVQHLDMEKLDQYSFQSVNGDLGGTWAPSSAVVIGGSGIDITGPSVHHGALSVLAASGNSFQGDTTFTGNKAYVVAVGSTFTVAGTLTTSGTATFGGALTQVTGAGFQTGGTTSVTLQGDVNFSNGAANVEFSSTPKFHKGALFDTAGTALQVASPAPRPVFATGLNLTSSSDNFDVAGPSSFAKAISLTGTASILFRYNQTPNADTTITINSYDVIAPVTLTTNRTCTLNNSTNGTIVLVTMVPFGGGSGSNQYIVKDQGGGTIISLQEATTSGHIYAAWLQYQAGAWYVIDFSKLP